MLAAELQESGMVRHESIVFDRDRVDPGPIRVVSGQSGCICSSGLARYRPLPAAGGLRAAAVAPGRAYKSLVTFRTDHIKYRDVTRYMCPRAAVPD